MKDQPQLMVQLIKNDLLNSKLAKNFSANSKLGNGQEFRLDIRQTIFSMMGLDQKYSYGFLTQVYQYLFDRTMFLVSQEHPLTLEGLSNKIYEELNALS